MYGHSCQTIWIMFVTQKLQPQAAASEEGFKMYLINRKKP